MSRATAAVAEKGKRKKESSWYVTREAAIARTLHELDDTSHGVISLANLGAKVRKDLIDGGRLPAGARPNEHT